MRKIIKQSSISVFLYYVGKIIGFLNKVYLLPLVLVSSNLGLFLGVNALAHVLARFSLRKSIIRYSMYWRGDKQKKGAFLGWVFVATTLVYVFIVVLFLVFKNALISFFNKNSPELIIYLPLGFVLGYLIVFNITLKAWYTTLGRVVYPNFLQHIILQSLISLVILLHYFEILSFRGLLLGMILPYTINAFLLIAYLWHIGELYINFDCCYFDRAFIYSFGVYSLFMLMGSSMALIVVRMDILMVLGMCGKHKAGIYGTVASIAMLLEVLNRVAKQTTSPLFVEMLVSKNYDRLAISYKKYTLYQFFFSSVLFSLLYANHSYLLYALPTEAINVSKQIFLLLTIGELIQNLFNTSYTILLLSKYFKLSIFAFLVLFLGLVANYFMIGRWGLVGAAGATFGSLLVSGLFTCWVIWYKLGIHPFSMRLAIVGLVTFGVLVVQSLLPIMSLWWANVGLRICFITAVYVFFAWYGLVLPTATSK